MNFLKGQKDKWAQEIKQLEDEKEAAVAKTKQALLSVEESDARFVELKDRIVQQGEKRKQEIIELAHHHSRMMLDDAHRRVESHLLETKNALKAEIVDMAMDEYLAFAQEKVK